MNETVMSENQAREEICRVGKSLFDRGLVRATAGNISVRLDDGFLITPTDACLGFLDPAQLARVDSAGRQTGGARASKTLALHQAIYAAAVQFDAGTRCIIHTHSTHCVALSLNPTTGAVITDTGEVIEDTGDELLPPLTPYFVMKVGRVPLIPYCRPGAPEAAQRVADTIARYGARGTPIRAVMMTRLGPNVWHDTPATAMAVLEELEETARLMSLTDATTSPLNDTQIAELRTHFGARW